MIVSKAGDILKTSGTCKVACVYTRVVVRTITRIDAATIEIDAMAGADAVVRVAADTPVYLEPWVNDRGSLLIPKFAAKPVPKGVPGIYLKLCGEYDLVEFPDGSKEHAEACPANVLGEAPPHLKPVAV